MKPPLTLPPRNAADHKGTFGRVMLVGGSRGMAGSIALSSMAALHAGSGLVSAAVPDAILETVAGFHPAIMTIGLPDSDGRMAGDAIGAIANRLDDWDAIGIGPGLTTSAGSVALLDGLVRRTACSFVVDADALNIIAEQGWLKPGHWDERVWRSAVLTPHPGELARLSGVAASDSEHQLQAAESLVKQTGATMVIKGGPTRVVGLGSDRHVRSWTNSTGNPGMATAGCGDVLTGVITALLGQGLSPWDAARLGVWVHGLAGDQAAEARSQVGITALHVLDQLATVAGSLEGPP